VQGGEAEGGEQRDGEVDGEEGLHREAEEPQRGNGVDEGSEPRPAAERDDEGRRGEQDEGAARPPARRGADRGEREGGRAQVEAQDVGEAAGEEVLAPPLVREVAEVPVEPGHDDLHEGERVDRVGEDDVRGKTAAPGAALDLARDQQQDRGGHRQPEGPRGREPGHPPPGAGPGPPSPAQDESHHDRLPHDLDARRGEADRQGERDERQPPPVAGRRVAREPENEERRPRRGLDVDVQVHRGEEEAPEGVDECPSPRRHRGEPQAARHREEREGGEGHVEGERERDAGVVGPDELEDVERVADRGQGQGDALAHQGVPQPHLAVPEAVEGEPAHRQEVLAEVAEVERRAGQRPAQEREECRERDESGRERAPQRPSGRAGRRRGAPHERRG
jgi:hypothetical protein